jgi:putative transcriptional regulator
MAIVKVTPALITQAMHETDWKAQDAKTDAEIVREIASNPDAAPILDEAETAAALARLIRHRLGMSQTQFAAMFRVPVGTLRDWEQGRKKPDAPALAYLRVIARDPEAVMRALAA